MVQLSAMASEWFDDTLERDIELRFTSAVEAEGWVVRKVEWPGRRGAPDRCCLGPDERVLWAEIKRPVGGRLAPLQKREHRILRAVGQSVWMIWNHADIERFVRVAIRGQRDAV